jgi:hypothetical protein
MRGNMKAKKPKKSQVFPTCYRDGWACTQPPVADVVEPPLCFTEVYVTLGEFNAKKRPSDENVLWALFRYLDSKGMIDRTVVRGGMMKNFQKKYGGTK